ncbi:hypothetical protein O1611_g6086 [Lasiodiplodia mahajangana]|uniref:Uncharacterized protein n=1 Tax=Lasiodiplodia mahajangana TaxID=1108764 RepID=A0ACC2JJ32_9PEZI|nr:hypothetical protein O1611_g6086 [Lasiodiplodia mahajangana]
MRISCLLAVAAAVAAQAQRQGQGQILGKQLHAGFGEQQQQQQQKPLVESGVGLGVPGAGEVVEVDTHTPPDGGDDDGAHSAAPCATCEVG